MKQHFPKCTRGTKLLLVQIKLRYEYNVLILISTKLICSRFSFQKQPHKCVLKNSAQCYPFHEKKKKKTRLAALFRSFADIFRRNVFRTRLGSWFCHLATFILNLLGVILKWHQEGVRKKPRYKAILSVPYIDKQIHVTMKLRVFFTSQ